MADLVTADAVALAWPAFAALDEAEQSALISAASSAVERYCGRSFAAAEHAEVLSGRAQPRVWLTHRPVTEVESVVVDGIPLAEGTWTVSADTGELLRGDGTGDPHFAPWFPYGRNNVVVTYTAGYETIPADIQRAVILLCRHYHEAMGGIGGIKSKKIGDFAYELATVSQAIPPVALSLLASYVEVPL